MSAELVALVLWATLTASLFLTGVSFLTRSWLMLWVAALFSLFFSLAAGLSIGPYVFLLTCLQLGGALARRWRLGVMGWALFLLSAVLVWVVIVPGQLQGPLWLPWVLAFPIVTILASLGLLVPRLTRLGMIFGSG